jgi:trehalose synthase
VAARIRRCRAETPETNVTMKLVQEVPIGPKASDSFADILGNERVEEVRSLADSVRRKLGGRTIWNVNSTAAGGGVAEMLHTLLAYVRGLGVDTRWLVINGTPDFFRITKRLHNALHGESGDGSDLGREATEVYEKVTAANAAELTAIVRPDDVVILHDPQTAGMIPELVRAGVRVIWRCHIGSDVRTTEGDLAWGFLERYLKQAHAFIFSRFSYLPDILYHGRCLVFAPSIDPFSPKNQEMATKTVHGILGHTGLISGVAVNGSRGFMRPDGTTSLVGRRAEVLREGDPPNVETPLVVQVSRWDRLKDPIGVLQGFVRSMNTGGTDHAQLMLAGPCVKAVADDPEGLEVFEEVVAHWRNLDPEHRRRVSLVTLPMNDLQENAAMVNALQRHAAIVVQKSLREGFGLTVTEAMWKSRPVIASAVGGIRDQVQHGVSGLLLKNPEDLDAFAGAVTQLLDNRGFAERLGRNAKRRVTHRYLGLRILTLYDDLIERLEHDPHDGSAPRHAEALPD